jgi:ribosomal protein S18 acetylase RimI-like enzyme
MLIQKVDKVTDELVQAFQRLMPQLTTNHPPPSWDELRALVAFPASTLLVARENASTPITGAATLALVRAPSGVHARLEDVIVDEMARGRGVGEALTREAIRLAKEAGADYIALTSNPRRAAANRLYQRVGFQKWETNVYRLEIRE